MRIKGNIPSDPWPVNGRCQHFNSRGEKEEEETGDVCVDLRRGGREMRGGNLEKVKREHSDLCGSNK